MDASSNAGTIGTDVADIGKAGIIVLNKTQLANNDGLEGTYVGILDNTQNPATPFNAISGIKATTAASAVLSTEGQSFTFVYVDDT